VVFTVFISHSSEDAEIVRSLYSYLKQSGINVFVAEYFPEPGRELLLKMSENIRTSDCILVLLTQSGLKSRWVQREIQIGIDAHRLIIPVVERGLEDEARRWVGNVEWISLDRSSPEYTLARINRYIQQLKSRKEEAERTQAQLAAGILGFLFGAIFIGLVAAAASQQ